jgi:pyruvate dehydrogenase E1 component beta subunit
MPSSPADAYGLLLSAVFDDDPCLVVEHTLLYSGGAKGTAPTDGHRVPLGVAHVPRPGSDVTVVTYGRMVHEALAAAEQLAGEGTDVEVVDLRTVAPFDRRTVLGSVAKTRRALIVHEAPVRGGVGGEISSVIHEELFGELHAPVRRVGAAFTPVPYAAALEQAVFPDSSRIVTAIRELAGS